MFQCITYLKPTLSRIIESLEANQVKKLIVQFKDMNHEECLRPILNSVSAEALSSKIYILGNCSDNDQELKENQQLIQFIVQSLEVQSIAGMITRLRESEIQHIRNETMKLIVVHMTDTSLEKIIGHFKKKDDPKSLSLLLETSASCLQEPKLLHALR